MNETREISALLHLIDDPDVEVFETVAEKLTLYGKKIIPNLEFLWENTPDESVQERIEMLIHRVNYQDLQVEWKNWAQSTDQNLFSGAFLVAKYQFPDLALTNFLHDLDKLKRNTWLELNNYLTPLEQINVVNSMVYNFFGLKGSEISYQQKNQFFINQVMESKKGNPITIGILYQVLCELLDLPVFAVNVPRQFILAYFDYSGGFIRQNPELPHYKIQFFIDPLLGQIFTQKDVESYLKRISLPSTPSFFKPLTNGKVIQTLLVELAKCFDNEKEKYKFNELMDLSAILGK
ncbi:MAG: transglutaminase-like domain-containing protein [Chitinophagaceae bacterium]